MAVELPAPIDLLPHRPPFLLVDRLVELEPGVRIVGEWTTTGEEYFYPGHFPGRPTLPGVLQVEALAQTGACAVLATPDFAGRLPLFGGVDNVKFRRQVVPGETLRLEVTLDKLGRRAGRGTGRALVGDELACQASLLFVIVDP